MRGFDEIMVGEEHRAGPIRLTRDDISAFARAFDPQDFHLDERAAAASALRGLAASGWQTAAVGMRLLYDGFVSQLDSMGAPGIEELRWLKPVRPDDALCMVLRVTNTRASRTRPDRGFVTCDMSLRNQADEVVLTQRFALMVRRQSAAEGAASSEPPKAKARAAAVGDAAPSHETLLAPDFGLSAPFDALEIGQTVDLGRHCFAEQDVISFAQRYDPQSFHLDREAARQSHFGDLAASGWHTAALWMEHFVAALHRSANARRAAGQPAVAAGPSPGFSNMQWLKPVRVGDCITYRVELRSKRPAGDFRSGILLLQGTGWQEDGALAFSFDFRVLWPIETAPA